MSEPDAAAPVEQMICLTGLLEGGGWYLSDDEMHVSVDLDVAIRAFEVTEPDGTMWVSLRLRGFDRHTLGPLVRAAQECFGVGASVRASIAATSAKCPVELRIDRCILGRGESNCVLTEEDVHRCVAPEASRISHDLFRQASFQSVAEAEEQKRAKHRAPPRFTSIEPLKVPAPRGWLAVGKSYKHVRTGVLVSLDRAKQSVDGSRWTLATTVLVAPRVDSVMLAGTAFIGEGKRVELVLTAHADDGVTIAHRTKPDHAEGIVLERDAVAHALETDPRLKHLHERVVNDDARFLPGECVPTTYRDDWTLLRTPEGVCYVNEPAHLVVSPEVHLGGSADERRIVIALRRGGTWSVERIMEGATAFLRRGTPVRASVLRDLCHTLVIIAHGVGYDFDDGIPLDEDTIERALAPWAQLLASASVPNQAEIKARLRKYAREKRGR